jgi:hypothetical protein
MLRTISQIAEAVNLHPDRIRDLIRKEEIIPTYNKPFRFDEYQQDYIFRIVYMEQRTNYITLPSKLNDSNFDTSELYSRENFISCGYIIKK